jgi:hypothetical protein
MAIIDELMAAPGLYLGIDTVSETDYQGAARLVVTPLPGASGVALDYEIFNPQMPENVRGHVEHTMLVRAGDGSARMVIAHPHASTAAFLRETQPGTFEPDGAEPFPMKVVISMTGDGKLRHAWWYGRPGGEAVERDVSTLERVT